MDPLSVVGGAISILALGYYVSHFASSDTRGLKTLYNGGARCDIVFVHGVSEPSWFPGAQHSRAQWMKDLLREDYPDARLLTFGYRLEKSRINYLSQMLKIESKRLLSELQDLRSNAKEKRPLIFLTYGLGGLVVKTALSDAAEADEDNESTLKMIQRDTAGVVFFGPPLDDENQKAFSSSLKWTARVELDLTPEQESDIDSEVQILSMLVGRFKSIQKRLGPYLPLNDEYHTSPEKQRRMFLKGIDRGLSRRSTYPIRFNGREDDRYQRLVTYLNTSLENYSPSSPLSAHSENPLQNETTQAGLKSPLSQDDKSKFDTRLKRAIKSSQEGNFNKAEKGFFGLLEEIEAVPGENRAATDLTIEIVSGLAHHFMLRGDYEKADLLFKRACTTLLEGIPPQYAKAARQLEHAAKASHSLGRLVEAQKSLERSIHMYSRCSEHSHPPLDVELRLARLHDERRQFDQAQAIYRDLYGRALARNSNDAASGDCLEIAQDQAHSYIACDKNVDAEKILTEMKEAWERKLNSLKMTRSGQSHGDHLAEMKLEEEEIKSRIITIVRQLIHVYQEQDKGAEADQERGVLFRYAKKS